MNGYVALWYWIKTCTVYYIITNNIPRIFSVHILKATLCLLCHPSSITQATLSKLKNCGKLAACTVDTLESKEVM